MPVRYAITGATVDQVRSVGGTDIKEARATGIIFVTLTEDQAARLKAMGCQVTPVGKVSTMVSSPVAPPEPSAGLPIYTPLQLNIFAGLEKVRTLTDPPLYGKNMNIAVIGTGIRETHELIRGRVVYSKNFTSDPMRDDFDHDTGVASIIVACAPECNILNLKVLDDNGEGTEEETILAIDDAISLWDANLDIAPLVINLSLGAPDDGNPSNSLRVACRAAIDKGILIAAAAGNSGPSPGTIMNPACERYVGAVGSCKPQPFEISSFSSRGPTKEGLVKPDAVLFGENIIMASAASDTATVAKSGTSFSTPFGSSIILICQEGIIRRVTYPEGIPAGLDPEVLEKFTAQDLMDKWSPRISVKPQGAPSGKDYEYGYGLPFGPLITQALSPAVDVTSILGTFFAISMLGVVVKAMR